MVVADLHVHTTNSDGTLTLERLPDVAREAGVEVVAITDHDRIHPAIAGSEATLDGVRIIHGIELRVETDSLRVDLLGYGVRRTDALTRLVSELQENRKERAREIVGRVEDRIGVTLDIAFEPGVGRPHIARAIAASDHEYGYTDAFEYLIGDDGPCYVSRDIPTFEKGRRTLADACDIVSLAHPLRYDDPTAALALVDRLDAVELHYLYGHEVDTAPVERAIEEHDLLVTGGSDAHEETLGVAGLDRSEFAAFQARLDSRE